MNKLIMSVSIMTMIALASSAYAQHNKPDKARNPHKAAKVDKANKPAKADKASKVDKPDKADKPANVNKTDKPEKANNGVKKDIKPGEGKGQHNIDKREAHQEKRINEGIKKGYLTKDEISKMESQQKSISDLEKNCKADGKLTPSEAKSIQKELNEASANIWAEKHDGDGNQKACLRLGKDVFANSNITTALSGDTNSGDAKKTLKDFHSLLQLKKTLATSDLNDDDRIKLLAEYNDLLNNYFTVK